MQTWRDTVPLVKYLTQAVLVAALLAASGLPARAADPAKKPDSPTFRVGIHIYKPGKIYDEALQGIRDGLNTEGIAYEEVVTQSKGDDELAKENLKKLDAMSLDLIYSLSSAGTQLAKDLKLKTPVIATVVGHPRTLGVGGDRSNLSGKLAGTSYYVDAGRQLTLYRSLFPSIRTVGMIFDAKNPAGVLAEEPLLREACAAAGLAFVSVGVEDGTQIQAAAEKLIAEKADVIAIPTNNLVYERLSQVLTVSEPRKIPVVSMNKQGVEAGALAALFADTYYLGRQTADLARKILVEKKDAAGLGFQYIPRPDLIVNMKSAKNLDYDFPPDILGEAAIVLQ